MVTLGIHDGHTATAAIAKNGKIISCISEERILRNKEVGGFPIEAIKKCIEISNVDPSEIKAVGIATKGEPTLHSSYNKPSIFKEFLVYLVTSFQTIFLDPTSG